MGGSGHDHGGRGENRSGFQTRSREHDRREALRALDKATRDNRANQLNPTHSAYHLSGLSNEQFGSASKMTIEDARRIQSSSDREDKNEDFKSRAMSAAAKNENK
ncbi:MAG: hypothetical protein ABSF44_09445 [Candidatus Bathyarchaeia archaeon]|jgi:hypothetical protein